MIAVSDYIKKIDVSLAGCEKDIETAISFIKVIKKNRKRLWALGNGGSMAIAQHFAQDMMKMRGVIAQAINCPSILTAFSNDVDFKNCFTDPLEFMMDHGDGILIFSCSGKSRNYKGIKDIGLGLVISVVGTNGGFLKEDSDLCIHVKSDNYQVCETAFSVVADLINLGMEN